MGLKSFFAYEWKYLPALVLSKFVKTNAVESFYLFVTHEGTKGWILDAKAKRLCSNSGLNAEVYYSENFRNLPVGTGYFFLHQKYFARSLRYNPGILKRKKIVMFTHPEWNRWYSARHMAFVLNFADEIVCLNSSVVKELKSLGIPEKKLHLFHMAADPELFTPKQRKGDGAIGFSMAYGPRKRPEMVVELIREMPRHKFILIGPGWDKYPPFAGIMHSSNLAYYPEIEYDKYPELYRQMDVYVSPSVLEGGPVPILEAMMSNVVPVASRTGFCPDIIEHGHNGFLFDKDASAETIKALIEKAYKLQTKVSEGIGVHSWENYGKKIAGLFLGKES